MHNYMYAHIKHVLDTTCTQPFATKPRVLYFIRHSCSSHHANIIAGHTSASSKHNTALAPSSSSRYASPSKHLYVNTQPTVNRYSMADLTQAQSAALFDVLTHFETYREIEDFKQPGAIHKYGPPFQDDKSKSSSPVLQTLISKFILPLPGLRDVSPEFWKVRITDIIDELSQAELSESFDKGILGIRKTLATAISALIEYPAKASLGGLPERKPESRKYDVKNPEDVLQAWQDCLQALVYGDLIDELFIKAAETEDLSKHDTLVQGMHEFVVVK
jgi:hypothetical protein